MPDNVVARGGSLTVTGASHARNSSTRSEVNAGTRTGLEIVYQGGRYRAQRRRFSTSWGKRRPEFRPSVFDFRCSIGHDPRRRKPAQYDITHTIPEPVTRSASGTVFLLPSITP